VHVGAAACDTIGVYDMRTMRPPLPGTRVGLRLHAPMLNINLYSVKDSFIFFHMTYHTNELENAI
jgi:hypothetical protein